MSGVLDTFQNRPLIMGRNGAVSSGHHLASLAGVNLLQQGGNAFDAAVAVAAALNVVEPNGSGLGGDSFILLYDSKTQNVVTINSTGPAPQLATTELFNDGIPEHGPLSASVPGAFSGWVTLVERFGRLSLRSALGPAIDLARRGFPVSHNLAAKIREQESFLRRYPNSGGIFFPKSHHLQPQELLVQEELAYTFERLGDGGHDEFYSGELAREICEAVRQEGGILDEDSLAGYRASVEDPLSIDYRGSTVYVPAPNSSGHVLLQELLMFEKFDPLDFEPQSAPLIHLMVEMKKIAFADRERYNGDPRFTGKLPEHLLSREYADDCVELINPDRPLPLMNHVPGHQSDDTTYFAVADREGNVVSMTTSINGSFGSGFIPGRTGILLNNRMLYWHLDSDHPNQLVPGKRVRHTVSPVITLRNEQPVFAIGTPGADGQVQTLFQVLVNALDYGVNPQLAVELPRWRSSSMGHESNYPHGESENLMVESRYPEAVIQTLRSIGHNVTPTSRLGTFGSCQAILIKRGTNGYTFGAAADPRRDAYALAW